MEKNERERPFCFDLYDIAADVADDGPLAQIVCSSPLDDKKATSSQLTLFCLSKQAATIDPVISFVFIICGSSDKPFFLVLCWCWTGRTCKSSLDDDPGGESTSVNAQFQTNVNVDEAEFVVVDDVGDGDGIYGKWSLLFEQHDLRRYFNTSDNCRHMDKRRRGVWEPADATPSLDIVIQTNE